MAWIKLETHIFDKLEIFEIAEDLGIDPDSVVGKCCRVWSWFDLNTVDGVTPSVTESLLDRYCGIAGFCKAMIKVGWMAKNDKGLSLPNYDRHNSQTAKNRALTAKRVSKHREKEISNAECNDERNDQTLPKSLDREDKIREDEIRNKSKSIVAKATKGSRFQESELPEDWRQYALKARPDLNPDTVFEDFKDYWISVAGQKGVKANWLATWRGWVRRQNGSTKAFKSSGDRNREVMLGLTRGLIGGENNVKLFGK